ncbi:MAG: CPBP family intramembrane glutamic endopeptidase [Pseudomonadota bacterium]
MSIALPDATALDPARRRRLAIEATLLFVGVPLVMLLTAGSFPLFPILGILTALAIILLAQTPDWSSRELLQGDLRPWLGFAAAYIVATLVITGGLVLWLVPDAFLGFPTRAPERWLLVMMLYPIVSVLPQELIFRPLFFRRYGGLFPSLNAAILANGLVFGIGHLFYQNPVAIGMTTFSGLIIGWAYARSGSFLLACILHAAGGMLVFTMGLGRFFYHGAIPT